MAYTSQTLVANQLKKTLTTDEQSLLAVLIPAVKQWIDLKTASTFDIATPTTRLYKGGTKFIDISPCTNITLVQYVDDYGVLQYTYQNFEVVYWPLNATVKDQIELRGYNEFADSTKFPYGEARIQVSATFSEYDVNNSGGGVPADIQYLATRLAASLLSNRPIGGIAREELEGHKVMYNFAQIAVDDPVIKSILESRKEIFVDIGA